MHGQNIGRLSLPLIISRMADHCAFIHKEALAWITPAIEFGRTPEMQLYERSMLVRESAILLGGYEDLVHHFTWQKVKQSQRASTATPTYPIDSGMDLLIQLFARLRVLRVAIVKRDAGMPPCFIGGEIFCQNDLVS